MSAPETLEQVGTLITLSCEICGWQVHGLMGGSNGTTLERARTELIARLHWSADGRRCGHCKNEGPRPGQRSVFFGCLRGCRA
jgi:hypothetical protein